MLDVAAVAARLWDHHLGSGLRNRLAAALGPSDPRGLIVFLAGAHDIGEVDLPLLRANTRVIGAAILADKTP